MPGVLKSVVMSPLWALSVFTGAKSFRDNGILGSRRLNELGLHARRVQLAYALALRRRERLAGWLSPEERAEFDANGFVLKRNVLPPEAFARLRAEVLDVARPAREMVQGDAVTRRIAIDPAFLAAAPELAAFVGGRTWRGLMRYAGSFDQEPVNYVQTILSHVRKAASDPQLQLHADTFHPNVKAWYFLNDVAEDEGPFCYVPGSHRLTPERLAWERARSLGARDADRLSSRGSLRARPEDLEQMKLPQPVRLAVPANTLVVGDTFGFHARGASVRPSVRVEIWGYGRRNPFLPWTGLDPASLPFVATRRVALYWHYLDARERLFGKNSPWQSVGLKKPSDPA